MNSSNKLEKEIKEEEDYHKEITYKPVIENSSPVGFRPISSSNLPNMASPINNTTIPNQTNSFSMNIGSKKGSAFNNLRNAEAEKN